ncbi:MAG: histidine phosphatase family protein [Bryobacterales bacterium]|nr:histidine phosphatase family protein [Bryobacterales bacterium]
MSVLMVVRHGQASFLAENYDKLSPLGERQARLLGEYWVSHGLQFTHVYYGPAERQIRTGEIIGDVFRSAGLSWPEPIAEPDLDEFPAEKVVRTFLPVLMDRHPHMAQLVEEFQTATEMEKKRRLFDRVLREVSERWLDGEVADDSFPTWPAFCSRVANAVLRVIDTAPPSSSVAVFTSAGPMAATARAALDLSHSATLNLTWSPRNASFSEFFFTTGRFSLSTFNTTPHLRNSDLLTYR